MQFKAFESGIEVNGQTVYSVVDGLGSFKSLAHDILLTVGIGTGTKTDYKIEIDGWYPQEKWLKAFDKIAQGIGNFTLKQIGLKIPVMPDPFQHLTRIRIKHNNAVFSMIHVIGDIDRFNRTVNIFNPGRELGILGYFQSNLF